MNLQAILVKTEKGVEEIETRKHKLDSKLRTLLIVVNGKSTAAELVQNFAQRGDVTPLLERLLAEGFVREAAGPSEGFKDVRVQLAQLLTDALGPPGDAFVLKLEECQSPEEARAFVEAHRAILERVEGPRGAAFLARAKALLG
jgi:hypothetical protein